MLFYEILVAYTHLVIQETLRKLLAKLREKKE